MNERTRIELVMKYHEARLNMFEAASHGLHADIPALAGRKNSRHDGNEEYRDNRTRT